MTSNFKQAALDYHEHPTPGKIRIELSKPANTANDLLLGLQPQASPSQWATATAQMMYRYTSKGNRSPLSATVRAILGLAFFGPLASKPVMEGKALPQALCGHRSGRYRGQGHDARDVYRYRGTHSRHVRWHQP
jgi:malate dehydrogenase (oxaloacetate-decarboxylating)(NADP+)